MILVLVEAVKNINIAVVRMHSYKVNIKEMITC